MRHCLALLALLGATACEGDAVVPTGGELPLLRAQVAIFNAGAEPVDVTLTSDFDETATFDGVLPGATTSFEDVDFTWLEEVQVACATGCVGGPLDLIEDDANTILVSPDGPPVLNPTDTEPPEVAQITPGPGAQGVALNTAISVEFSEPMSPASITTTAGGACTGAIQLSADGFGSCVVLQPAETTDDQTFVAAPMSALQPSTDYRIKVTVEARDALGTALVEDVSPLGFRTGTEADDGPPAAITDLTAGAVTATSVELEWTSPGDDGDVGTAASYDVRYLEGACPFNFVAGTRATGEPVPLEAGGDEAFEVTGLDSETAYCFAVRTSDEVPNESEDSNFVSATTGENTDAVAPAKPSISVGGATESSLRVSWTAVADDGSTGDPADSYELRYTSSGCPSHDGSTFSSGQTVGSMPAPLSPGSPQSKTVGGLLDETTYCFVLRVVDENGNAAFSDDASGTTLGGYW